VVAFVPNGDVLVGHAARKRRHIDPHNTIFSAKRLIGQSFYNPIVQLAVSTLPYHVEEGPNQQPMVVVRGRRFTVPEISSYVLLHLKRCAERHLGVPVSRAVITVPANFTDSQRQATKHAGELAGLKVLRVLNEPTAAALAYGFGKALDSTLAIYDLGGGTFDVTVLQVRDKIFEVLATGGDSFLGGDDFDRALINRLAADFLAEHHIDLRDHRLGWSRLLLACEEIKCKLSSDYAIAGTISDLVTGRDAQAVRLDFELTRDEFERLIAPDVDRSLQVCRQVLTAAQIEPRDLSDLILVGGSTRTPLVRQQIECEFGCVPQTRINPDETVAYGAALQAAALTSGHADPTQFYSLLLDVCPRALGLGVAGGFAERVVEANTPIPLERTRTFITSKDYQTEVDINVCQGEQRRFAANEILGTLQLHGLAPAPRGKTCIAVTFTIDANGILSVRAVNADTGLKTEAVMRVIGAPTGSDSDGDDDHRPPASDEVPSPA
jgi:molecular chaperone DnaK